MNNINKSKTIENLFENTNYDTRKRLNRSDKSINIDTVKQIAKEGITSERLQDFGVPIYRYKTQITIHGRFPKAVKNLVYLDGYKHLIYNKNQSLGVKYQAVDYNKKREIYQALSLTGWQIHRKSDSYFAFKTSPIRATLEEIKKFIPELQAEAERINTNLFIGGVGVEIKGLQFVGYFAVLILSVNLIAKENIILLINQITGTTKAEREIMFAEIEAYQEKDDRQWKIKHNKEKQQKIQLIAEAQKALEKHSKVKKYIKYTKEPEPGFYIKPDIPYFPKPDTKPRYKVTKVFKQDRKVLLRKKPQTYNTLQEAINYNPEDFQGSSWVEKCRYLKKVYTLSITERK